MPDLDLRSPSPAPSESGSVKVKGKERESIPDNIDEESGQNSERLDVSMEDKDAYLSEEESGPSCNGMVQELRNMQAAESGTDFESVPTVRPPTPIPAPSIVAEEHHDMSHAELSQALGSWLGGRSQNQTRQHPTTPDHRASQSTVLAESSPSIPYVNGVGFRELC